VDPVDPDSDPEHWLDPYNLVLKHKNINGYGIPVTCGVLLESATIQALRFIKLCELIVPVAKLQRLV
jgi:hypothetical protein